MINIIPEEKKILIQKERTRRFTLVFGIAVIFAVSISAVLLIPSYLYLIEQKKHIARIIEVLESGPIFKEIQDIENSIEGLNQKLSLFQRNQNNILNISFFIEKILEQKPPSVRITNISYNNLPKSLRISLSGSSPTRDLLLKFVENLNKEESIKKVHSPITNILKEQNIEFSLIIEFN